MEAKELVPIPHHLKSILPAVIALKDYMNISPGDMLDTVSQTLHKDGWHYLDKKELKCLKDYLEKWNLEDYTKQEE